MDELQPSWDDPGLYPQDKSDRRRRYRRLQSWYREVQLGAEAGPSDATGSGRLGSLLDPQQVERQPDLNFLHPAAAAHARERAVEVQAEGGSLEVGRLRHNMLSSMPLCFNLFGALRAEPAFLDLFRRCFDPDAESILDVVCEWSPRPAWLYLGDRTAFDAVVFYRRAGGAPAFMGIETKYTEPFSPKPYGAEDGGTSERGRRYRAVTAGSGWFTAGLSSVDELQGPKANQLWRTIMLAATVEAARHNGAGSVAVVCLDDDTGASAAIDVVRPSLVDPEQRLRRVDLQALIAEAKQLDGITGWADRFERRYLAHDPVGTPAPTPDPSGPRFGRPLDEPDPSI